MAPRVTENVPAPQSVHVALPVTVLYFPATQAVHATPSGPEYPVLQTQLSMLVLAVEEFVFEGHAEQVEPVVAPRVPEYVPAPQSAHAAEPVASLYFPAKQAVHTTPSGPEYPVLQTQLSTLVLAVGEFVYKGHA